MASPMEQFPRGSRKTVSFHGAHYPSSCNDQPDFGCAEDLGDFHDPLEQVDAVESGDQLAGVDNDSYEIAWRALDLLFPLEDIHDNWSDWSAQEGSVDDVDDGEVIIDGGNETDCSVDDDRSTQVGDDDDRSTQVGDDDYYNGQVIDEQEEPDCPGKIYSLEELKRVERKSLLSFSRLSGAYSVLCNEIRAQKDDATPFPPYPLRVLPNVTAICSVKGMCYHSAYKTHDTSTTASTLGYRIPKGMLQLFSMHLSSSEPSYPTSVYGIFAVRDYLDPRRNYVFNRPRDDAVTIEKQGSFDLPLCSPCRGIYIVERALLEVDLWVKKEGDGSADKQLLSAYVEIENRAQYDEICDGRIPGNDCNLDVRYMFLGPSVETVIQVYAKVDHTRHVKFTAVSDGYDDSEIVMFDDKVSVDEKLFQHIVAVHKNKKLNVLLKVEQSLFQWTFQDGFVGAVSTPDDSIFEYGQFCVRVFFAPKDSH